MIPYGRQDIAEEDIAAVQAVLRSDYLTQGPMIPRFERTLIDRSGASHAVAVNSATAALHVACLALGLGPGDWLWTTPNTFLASANCALYCGAQVDFVDIDPRTYNLSIEALAAKLEAAAATGRLPRVVVPVHFSGQSCDMAAIGELARRYRFHVIEDASHALGATYEGAPVGCCRHSDVTVFSFHPVKIVTTGEGGAAVTNDAALAQRMALFRAHGMTRERTLLEDNDEGGWYYEQQCLGFNYRITDMQAALGVAQMDRLDAFLARRRELADRYDRLLADLPVTRPWRAPDRVSAWHLYVVGVDPALRRRVFEAMRATGIGVNVHYIPVHTQPHYRRLGFQWGDFPVAERYYAGTITLPLHSRLTDAEQDQVVASLARALG